MTKTSPQVSSLVAPVPQLPSSLDKAQDLERKAMAEAQKWNTQNLGLRLGSDFVAAASAAVMVAPIITVIDKGIMENASGRAPLGASLRNSFKAVLRRPHTFILSTPFALICMLYGGTYLTANTLDTITSTVTSASPTLVTSGTMKFAASSTANVSLTLIKDRTFARLFGPSGPPRPVPLPTLGLFALRDCLTIFASFNIPPLLGPVLTAHMGDEMDKRLSGRTIAQFMAPAAVQFASTPLHLLGLDLYNREKGVSWADRWAIVKKNWGISVMARVCRIVPAFGIGGVVNAKVRRNLMEKWE